MADFTQAEGVKTFRDNEFKIKLVDGASGTTATKVLTVADVGDTITAGVNDFGIVPLAAGSDAKWHAFSCDASGFLNVVVNNTTSMVAVNDYVASVSVASGTPVDHDKVITSGKTATKIAAVVASAGLIKWDLGTYDGTTFTVLATAVTSPSSPQASFALQPSFGELGNGTLKIRLEITNLDASQAQNCYSTLEFIEA